MADEATLAAGTIVKFDTLLVSPTFAKLIAGILSMGAVGDMAEAKERTVLADTSKKYGAGMKDAPDKSIKGQLYALDVNQQAFLQLAKDNATIMVKVEYPTPVGADTGVTATMEFKLLGYELDDVTGEDWMMFTVNAKQNSIVWTDAVATP
tara:strand:- start:33256 stop:33708 length:453 start_codon:yes stop_codon:yes gene_type:complete